MQRSVKITLVAVVVVLVGATFAFWWFVLRGDAPERASLPTREGPTTTVAEGDPGSPVGSPDGTWVVAPASDVFVGYRIQELFGGETLSRTAVGRTPAVSGTMAISGGQVTAVDVTADLSQLASDSSQRDNFIRGSALETRQFPEARFLLTQPLAFPGSLDPGGTVEVTAVGDLTLHGVTRTVQVPLQASWNGSSISVAGSTHVVLSDHAIEAPDIALVKVEGEGELEIQLVFERA